MSGDLEHRNYVPYDSGLSKVPDGEAEDIEAIRSMFTTLINGDFEKHGHTYPVTHAKTLGLVKGKIIVTEDLPKHLKQSMFIKAGEYPVLLRYSTNHHNVGTADPATPSRAATIKIFNVDGDRFPEGAGNTTQDFELNSSMQVAELADARTAKEMIAILMKKESAREEDQKEAIAELKSRKDIKLQIAPAMVPNSHVASLPFYSQVPHRFGSLVGKHALIPATDHQKQLLNEISKGGDPPNVMANKLKEYYAEHDTVYEWQFQLLENPQEQSIEYAGTPWDATKYPYQTVARLVFPKQDSYNYELKSFYEDHLRSNMWRGLKSLEPLGSTNRVRRAVYPYAGKMREKLNGRRIIDIQHFEELPGPIPEGAQVKPSSHGFAGVNHPELHHSHLGGPLPSFPSHFASANFPTHISSKTVFETVTKSTTTGSGGVPSFPSNFPRW